MKLRGRIVRREPSEEPRIDRGVKAPVCETVRREQVMDLVAERKRGGLMPRGETHIGGERTREEKRPTGIGDRGKDRWREAGRGRGDEQQADDISRQRAKAERE